MSVKRNSVFLDVWQRKFETKVRSISKTAKNDPSLVQRLGLIRSLEVHKGCVNTICWNEKGTLLLSGSDDQHLAVTDGFTYQVRTNYNTSHKANIFSAKFLPCTSDYQIVSCSGDGIVLHTDLNRQQETYHSQFLCHGGTTSYEVMTVPDDPHIFMSCGEDGTVRWFDLREKSCCLQQRCKDNILVSCQRAITALAISPTASHQLAVGCADSTVRIYDRRYLSVAPEEHLLAQPFCSFAAPKSGEDRHYRITSLTYDEAGREILVSYSSDYLYLFNVQETTTIELKKPAAKQSPWERLRAARSKRERNSPPPVRRLRLRGDWSDTGPDARPERDVSTTVGAGGNMETDDGSNLGGQPLYSIEGVGVSDNNNDGPQVVQTSSSEPATPHQEPSTSSAPTDGSSPVTSDLHNHLTALRSLRQGFINQHGAEPSVSFRYSDQSTSSSTISLRANNEPELNATEAVQSTNNVPNRGLEMDVDYPEEDDLETGSEAVDNKTVEQMMMFEAQVKAKYTGHRNARTMITTMKEATFWGSDFVMSGSDCGHVFIWDRHTTKLHMLLQADQHVVNCLQPHPTLPILATSGIDHDIKLWEPNLQENGFHAEAAADLIDRNAVMLEQTRDTITVPAAFMIRMLACLNQIRRGVRNRTRRFSMEEET